MGHSDHDHHDLGTSIRQSRWVGDFPRELSRPTIIGSDVWLGYGVIILSGVRVGDSSVIAAGAVVTRDVPANSIVVGNPGRVISQRFTEGELALHWEGLRKAGHRILVGMSTSTA
ncbi:DapH/DapD/GlmU-related protein [Cryobacterium sp. Y11]|uniref:DapH/DapD/GlmU-related protein n=1 Tax=Cryobacterium sp. Y11 TaxID=2045016 RepID=UPI001E5DEA33|nr:DapH/DapD/GlmU-related protein [Cryobacterium sp. Y11]